MVHVQVRADFRGGSGTRRKKRSNGSGQLPFPNAINNMSKCLTTGYVVTGIFLTRRIEKYALFSAVSCLCLSSCAPSSIGGMPTPQPLYTQAQTIGLEDSDRISRFQRLAEADGIEPPTVEQIYAPAGTVPGAIGPVPVVRVSFDEGVFFASGQDTPLPGALAVIDLIAQNMQRDVPDAALTIIGNTDSVGTDAYNDNLSERRAIHVMRTPH